MVNNMARDELKYHLKQEKAPVSGNKGELLERFLGVLILSASSAAVDKKELVFLHGQEGVN